MNSSRLLRERRWLIIRLAIRGYSDCIFHKYLRNHQIIQNDGQRFIPKSKLTAIVGRDFELLFDWFLKLCMQKNDMLPIESFITFLRTGLQPGIVDVGLNEFHDRASGNTGETDQDVSIPLSCENTAEAIWRKHETIIQERIVIYTSIDLQGVKQRVVETDKTQKDCIHVENSSGIFAHREYTQQEQTEDIDDEQVTFIRASEEYVHLKREDDEYEYVHSEIPPTETMQDDDRNDENNDSDSSLETKRKGF